jgi:lysophospholipase L1-like esterase
MMEQIGIHPYKWFFFLMLITACSSSKLVNEELPSITIHTIGDSTMANKPNPAENPERGWVQMLTPFFNTQATLFNHAVNGRSTKSFRELGHWQPVFETLKPGDYLIIQFGHNDAKETDPVRYTNPQTSYRHNLTRYVEEARSKGANPILCSSIARRKFNEQGVLLDAHGNYTLVARMVALEMQVPFIDLQYHTEQLELAYGVEASKKLHLHYAAGEHPYFPEGITDNTHLSELGATEIARLFVEELVHSNHVLSKYVIR